MNDLITVIKTPQEENRLIECYGIENILFLNPLENKIHSYILQIKNNKVQKKALKALSYSIIVGIISGEKYLNNVEIVITEDILNEFLNTIE